MLPKNFCGAKYQRNATLAAQYELLIESKGSHKNPESSISKNSYVVPKKHQKISRNFYGSGMFIVFDRELRSQGPRNTNFLLLLLRTLVKNLLVITVFVVLCKLCRFLVNFQKLANFVELCKFCSFL